MEVLSDELKTHWRDFIVRRLKSERAFPDWRGDWGPLAGYILHNQKALSKAVEANLRPSQIAKPLLYHPLPRHLTSWDQLGSQARLYNIPSEMDLLNSSVLVNVWASQWGASTQETAARRALAVQRARLLPRVPDLIAASGEELRLWLLVHGSASDGQRLLRGYQQDARAARRGPYSRR